MLAVHCPEVPTPSGLTLLPLSRIVRMTDDGAGRITTVLLCYYGHLHEVVDGQAVVPAPAVALAS